jgi:hypothetical protein
VRSCTHWAEVEVAHLRGRGRFRTLADVARKTLSAASSATHFARRRARRAPLGPDASLSAHTFRPTEQRRSTSHGSQPSQEASVRPSVAISSGASDGPRARSPSARLAPFPTVPGGSHRLKFGPVGLPRLVSQRPGPPPLGLQAQASGWARPRVPCVRVAPRRSPSSPASTSACEWKTFLRELRCRWRHAASEQRREAQEKGGVGRLGSGQGKHITGRSAFQADYDWLPSRCPSRNASAGVLDDCAGPPRFGTSFRRGF